MKKICESDLKKRLQMLLLEIDQEAIRYFKECESLLDEGYFNFDAIKICFHEQEKIRERTLNEIIAPWSVRHLSEIYRIDSGHRFLLKQPYKTGYRSKNTRFVDHMCQFINGKLHESSPNEEWMKCFGYYWYD